MPPRSWPSRIPEASAAPSERIATSRANRSSPSATTGRCSKTDSDHRRIASPQARPDNRRAMAKGETKADVPAAVERRIWEQWEKGGFFHAEPDGRPRDQRFCMVIPPPNVTGALHLGHALNNTLQDILIRQKRMAGNNTFWL